MNKESPTSFGVMWGESTQPCSWHGKQLWFARPLKASLFTSTTAPETAKSISRSTWSQYNKSKNADLPSLTYHQHYPALENDKSIGRSNVNVWPWKPHLSPWHWVSQHRIGQVYWQVHKWKGQNTAQTWGKSPLKDLTANPEGSDPEVYW